MKDRGERMWALQVLAWGLRGLRGRCLLPVRAPSLEVQCGGHVLRIPPITDLATNPNFPINAFLLTLVSTRGRGAEPTHGCWQPGVTAWLGPSTYQWRRSTCPRSGCGFWTRRALGSGPTWARRACRTWRGSAVSPMERSSCPNLVSLCRVPTPVQPCPTPPRPCPISAHPCPLPGTLYCIPVPSPSLRYPCSISIPTTIPFLFLPHPCPSLFCPSYPPTPSLPWP